MNGMELHEVKDTEYIKRRKKRNQIKSGDQLWAAERVIWEFKCKTVASR